MQMCKQTWGVGENLLIGFCKSLFSKVYYPGPWVKGNTKKSDYCPKPKKKKKKNQLNISSHQQHIMNTTRWLLS